MRPSFARRLLPGVLTALGIIILIVLAPQGSSTYEEISFAASLRHSLAFGLIPIVLVESFVLRRRMKLEWWKAIGVTSVANVASMVAGMLGILRMLDLIEVVRSTRGWTLAPVAILLLPVCMLVEYPITRSVLGPDRSGTAARPAAPGQVLSNVGSLTSVLGSNPSLLRGMVEANVASYAFFLTTMAVTLPAGGLFQTDRGSYLVSSIVGALRTINTAEQTYDSTYKMGFSPSLAALDGSGSELPNASSAQLIDSILGSGEKLGYQFVYTPGPRTEKGEITSYSVIESPKKRGAGYYYYTDQSGVIRWNKSRPATAADGPLAG